MNRIPATAPIATALLLITAASAIDTCTTPNTPIPDNGEQIAVPIFIAANQNEIVDSITLDLTMTHTWVGDLLIELRAPDGTTITLLDRPGIPSTGFPGPFGCGGQDIACTFTDSATTPAESICTTTASPVIAGPVVPAHQLSIFQSLPGAGNWQLLITDQSPYDAGILLEACLSVNTITPCPADLNNDAQLDFFDVSAFLDAFGNADPAADFTNDGDFDFFDVSAFLDAFASGC